MLLETPTPFFDIEAFWKPLAVAVAALAIGGVGTLAVRRIRSSHRSSLQVTTSGPTSPVQVAGDGARQQLTVDQSQQSFHGESKIVVQKVEPGATLNINYYEYVDGLPQAPDAQVRRLFEEARQLHAKGEYDAASEKFLECLRLEKDAKRRGALYIQLGNRFSEMSNYVKASEWYGLALVEARKAADKEGEAAAVASVARTWVDRPARDAGAKTANIRHALDLFSQALTIYSTDEHPFDHAMTQNNIGVAYGELPGTERERAANLRSAVLSFEEALRIFSRTEYPIQHAMVQNNLGGTYLDISATAQERAQNIKNAVACFDLASRIYVKSEHPVEYARALSNLGEALRQLPSATPEERAANLQKAISGLEEAAEVWRVALQPVEFARTEVNLGSVYAEFRPATNDDLRNNLRKAISCYQRALQVFRKDEYPVEYAKTQTSLGATYAILSSVVSEERAKDLEEAVCCYQRALSVISKETYASDYAMAQHNLGNAHMRLAVLNPVDQAKNVNIATTCFREAITVWRRDAYPQYYCQVAAVLGSALALTGNPEACHWLKEAYSLKEYLPVQNRNALEEMIAQVCKE